MGGLAENNKQERIVILQNDLEEEEFQEDDELQVAPINPGQVDAPQQFNPEQQQENEALQAMQMDPEPELEQPDAVPQVVQEGSEAEAEHEEGISQDFQGDPEPEIEQQEEEVFQVLQGGPEPEAAEQEDFINQPLQISPALEVEEGVFALQGDPESEVERQEQGAPQILQDPDPEIKDEMAPLALKRDPEFEIGKQEERDLEPEVEQDASRVSQESRRELVQILHQMPHRSIMLTASEVFRPSWEEARREILQQISQYNIVPVAFELRPSWEEASWENLCFNFEQIEFRIARQELNAYQRNQTALLEYILRLLLRAQFEILTHFSPLGAPPPLLALEAPPPLLALEAPPPLLAQEALHGQSLLSFLEGGRFSSVLDFQPLSSILKAQSLLPIPDVRSLLSTPDVRSLLSTPDVRSLLSTPDVRSLLPAPEERVALSKENEIYSGLQKRKRADLQEPSEFMPVCAREPAEALAVRPKKTRKSSRKHQQQTELFDPGEPDPSLDPAELQKLMEFENQEEIQDPGEPNFSDPRELLKDLNFGEMIADDVEVEPVKDPEMESLRDLENEAEEDLENEDDDNLLSEVCQPLIPPAAQRPNQDEVIDIESDDAEEDAPCAAAPDRGGDHSFHSNGRCPDGEKKMEEEERKKDEDYPKEMQEFITWLFSCLLLFIITGNVLNVLSYIYDWRGLRTHTTLIPVIFNVTTPMTTTIFNVTSSDFDTTTSTNPFAYNMTEMDL